VLLGSAWVVLLLLPLPIWTQSLGSGQRLPVAGTAAVAVVVAWGAYIAWRQRQEAQAADRFTRALEMLEADSAMRRAAGARALGALAVEVPAWQPDVVETLCTFIRHRSAVERKRWDFKAAEPLIDVEAAMSELARRTRRYDGHAGGRLDLRNAHLPSVRLKRLYAPGVEMNGAHLEHAKLEDARLEGAWLIGADLYGAALDDAHLEGAWLRRARLDEAWLTGAHLEGARLNGAHLEGALKRPGFDGGSGYWISTSVWSVCFVA